MTRVEILYLLPYLFSLVLSLGITIYAWEHRQIQGARAYAYLTSAQTLSILGFLLELLSPDLNGKIFWDKFQWIAFAGVAIAIPIFAIQYTDYKIQNPKLVGGIFSAVPVGLILLVLLDPWFHFIYPNPGLSQAFVFGELQYDLTWAAYGFAAYGYLTTLLAFLVLARRVLRPHRLYRAQVTAIIIGLLIPVFGTALPIFGVQITALRDATPITIAIGNITVAWGIFRYRLLRIIHIARDKIIESMDDFVFVLDERDRIIDINQTALNLLGLKPSQIIGQQAEPVFAEWPDVLKKFDEPVNANLEVIIERQGQYLHFDVKSTLIHDHRGEYQGRIFVARDITPYAVLQWKLKQLNEELEQRVRDRTEELAEAYDTTLEGWARALELRDKETEGHSRRVTDLTLKLARALNVAEAELDDIRRGALLHDIGKMAIPDEILRKAKNLTPAERGIVAAHPVIAYQLLLPIKFLEKALEIPYCHHEKWDGTGYPRGLKGDAIPLSARIFSVVDVWDAILSNRIYRKAWPVSRARIYMKKQAARYFDPHVVNVFLDLMQ